MPVAALAALLGCGGDGGAADARLLPDAPAADGPLGDGPAADALPAANPAQLWLAGINGSEVNLELVDTGPPNPF